MPHLIIGLKSPFTTRMHAFGLPQTTSAPLQHVIMSHDVCHKKPHMHSRV